MDILDRVKRMTLAMQRYPWEQGVCAQAFLESGDSDVTIALAREAVHRGIPDGCVAMVGHQDAVTDPCANGEPLLFAYQRTGDPIFKEAETALRGWALEGAPRDERGTVYHIVSAPQHWVDSMYMLPPYLAAAGLYAEALKQIDGCWDALFLPQKKQIGRAHV